MSKKNTKLIIVGLIILAGVGASIWQKVNLDTSALPSNTVISTPALSPQLTLYHNAKYNYSFVYDANYFRSVSDSPNGDSIAFTPQDYRISGVLSVNVLPVVFSTPDAWLSANSAYNRFEKRMKIDGYDAIISIPIANEAEKDPGEIAVLVKGGKTFVLSAQYANHEAFWNSFHFDK